MTHPFFIVKYNYFITFSPDTSPPGDQSRGRRTDELVDRSHPITIRRILATTRREIQRLKLHGKRSRLACSHRATVNTNDWRHLHPGTTHEELIGGIQLCAVNTPLLNRDTELFLH